MNAPVFNGGVTGRGLTEDSTTPTLAVFGQIISFIDTSSTLDPDFQGLNLVEPANKIGEFTVTLRDEANGLNDPWGSVEWSYSVANADVQYLAAGETRVMVYKIEIIDLDGNTLTVPVTVTITGTNDAPVITTAAAAMTLDEDAATQLTATSALSFTDIDSIDTHSASVTSVTASGKTTGLALDTAALQALLSTTVSTTAGTAPAGATGQIAYTFSAPSTAFQYLAQGEQLTLTYTLTLSDGKGGTATRDVSIIITGANDAPVLSATNLIFTDTAENDDFAPQSGQLQASDPDTSDTLTYGLTDSTISTVDGFDRQKTSDFGTLHINTATGAYLFIPDSSAIQALKGTASASFTVTASDGKGGMASQTFTITLNGANDAAVVTGDITGRVTEDGTLPATGNLEHTDRDTADTNDAWNPVSIATGSFGTLTLEANGEWTYTLNNDDPRVQALNFYSATFDRITVTTSDGTQQEITVEIIGANDASVSEGSSGTVDEAGGFMSGPNFTRTVSGNIDHTDVDDTNDVWQTDSWGTRLYHGEYGYLVIAANGAWTYYLDQYHPSVDGLSSPSDTLNETITVYSQDGTAHSITISITGANDDAVISGNVVGTITEAGGAANGTDPNGGEVTGNLDHTDVDFADLDDRWTAETRAGTYGSLTIDPRGNWTYTLDNDNQVVQALNASSGPLTDTITVTTSGGTPQVITITINGANDASVSTGSSGTVGEAGGVANATNLTPTVSGNIDHTDVDNTDDVWQAGTVNGRYGSLVIGADGAWTVDFRLELIREGG